MRALIFVAAVLLCLGGVSASSRLAYGNGGTSEVIPPPFTLQHMGGGPGELVFENRWVRAYRVRLEPHQHIPMHRLTSRLVVWLTDAHLRDSLSTGKVQEVAQKSGDVTWVPAQRHAGVNLGDAPVSFIAVEIK